MIRATAMFVSGIWGPWSLRTWDNWDMGAWGLGGLEVWTPEKRGLWGPGGLGTGTWESDLSNILSVWVLGCTSSLL